MNDLLVRWVQQFHLERPTFKDISEIADGIVCVRDHDCKAEVYMIYYDQRYWRNTENDIHTNKSLKLYGVMLATIAYDYKKARTSALERLESKRPELRWYDKPKHYHDN